MGRIRQKTARRENDGQIQALVSDCDRLNQEVSSSVTLLLWLFHCLRLSCPWARCSTHRCFSRPAQYSATDTVDTWTEGEAGRTEREQLWTLVTHREVSESLIERILISGRLFETTHTGRPCFPACLIMRLWDRRSSCELGTKLQNQLSYKLDLFKRQSRNQLYLFGHKWTWAELHFPVIHLDQSSNSSPWSKQVRCQSDLGLRRGFGPVAPGCTDSGLLKSMRGQSFFNKLKCIQLIMQERQKEQHMRRVGLKRLEVQQKHVLNIH